MKPEDIKRIEKVAKKYALTLVDEHDGTPQFICFKAGATYEHNYLTTQVVEAERKGWNEAIDEMLKRIKEKENENRMDKHTRTAT